MVSAILRVSELTLGAVERACCAARNVVGWWQVYRLLDSGRGRVVLVNESTPTAAPVVRSAPPVRPPEHPNFSVVWPDGDPSKGGRFDGK
jgi:hypothetical protein